MPSPTGLILPARSATRAFACACVIVPAFTAASISGRYLARTFSVPLAIAFIPP